MSERAEGLTGSDAPGLTGRVDYHPPGGPGTSGFWQATCPSLPGFVCRTSTFQQAVRELAKAAAAAGVDPARLQLRVGGLLAMNARTASGQVHIAGTGISLPHLLRTMAEEGSLAGVLEHFPVIGRAEAAAALYFAAAVLDNLRWPPAARAKEDAPGEGLASPAPPEADS